MPTAIPTLAAQVITATGSEAAGHELINDSLDLEIVVTAVSGTSPSITFSVQWSDDGSTFEPASPADAFTAMTGTGGVVERFTVKGAFYRLAWTVSGTTPSFTVNVFEYV